MSATSIHAFRCVYRKWMKMSLTNSFSFSTSTDRRYLLPWRRVLSHVVLPSLTAATIVSIFHKKKSESPSVSSDSQNDSHLTRIISKDELARHKSAEDGGIWVSCRNKVYDITEFVQDHPGGDKILLAAGSDVLPYWSLYAFHFEDHVMDLLQKYYIGDLPVADHADTEVTTGLYANEPERHPALVTVSKAPRDAETPLTLIPDHPITSNELFFVRNHFPVPDIKEPSHTIQLISAGFDGTNGAPVAASLSVDDLKNRYPRYSFVSTIVCAGNRGSDMFREHRKKAKSDGDPFIRGLGWGHSAISTAEWSGVRLVDLLAQFLCPEDETPNYAKAMDKAVMLGIRHVQFEGCDEDEFGSAFGASLPVEWAMDPQMDVLIAYEMNGQPLPRDHGYPLRVVVPGSIGARQVKWLRRITLSSEESPSFYHRTDYKIGYKTNDGEAPDYTKIPAILDYPVQSVICEPFDGQLLINNGFLIVKGYAFSGGGRGILSVRVSIDDGETWSEATLHPVSPPAGIDPSELAEDDLALAHRTRRQWAWTIWEAEVEIPEDAENVELVCCARDSSNATQPKTVDSYLNIRGLLSNSWHHVNVHLKPAE